MSNRGRPPFGYDSAGNPIQHDLNVLDEVDHLLRIEALSLREGAEYISHKTGKSISHVGLRDRLARGVLLDGRETNEG